MISFLNLCGHPPTMLDVPLIVCSMIDSDKVLMWIITISNPMRLISRPRLQGQIYLSKLKFLCIVLATEKQTMIMSNH